MHRPIPQHRHLLIRRSRLFACLDDWPSLRLIAVTAPTGFGKSTLIADWMHSLSDDVAAIWLSLGPEHADAAAFAHAIGEALLPLFPALAEPLAELRAGRFSPVQLTQALAAKLARSPQPLVFVLDDLHLVTDPEAHLLLQQILDGAVPHVHLVCISRTTLPIRFSRLLLHDAALALDERHLRFDHDEFLAFVQHSRLASLPEPLRADIERRADGWIAALRLIDLSLTNPPATPIDALLGPHSGRLLIDYLKSDVFDHLPSDLRDFLLDAAPLPFLTPSLLAAATDRPLSIADELLQRVLHANLFLSAFESDNGSRFRIHPLFREFLLRTPPADPTRHSYIRRRAAEWLASHHDIDQALALLMPEHPDLAADLLAAGPLRAALLDFDLAAARRWLSLLAPAAIDARPQLAVDAAWLNFLAEECDLEQHVERAQAALARHREEPASAELQAEANLLAAFGQLLLGRIGAAQSMAEVALCSPCAELGLAAGYQRVLSVYLPDPQTSPTTRGRALRSAETIFHRIRFVHGALQAINMRAVYDQRIGDAIGACAAFEDAVAALHVYSRENSFIAVDVHFFFGDHLYSLNRIDEARMHLERAVAIHTHSHVNASTTYHAIVALQLCDLAEDRPPENFTAEDDAIAWKQICSTGNFGAVIRIGWLRLLRDARMQALERCRHTFDSLGILPADLTADHHDMLWLVVLAGAVFSRHPTDEAVLSEQLQRLIERVEQEQNTWLAQKARAVLALHRLSDSDDRSGANDARRILQPLADCDNCRRLLLDVPQLAAVLGIAVPAPDALSERERELLTWMASDLTNKEIAQALSVTLSTVYAHTQSIYRKLGVHSRQAAVRKSRE